MTATLAIDTAPARWSGRDDGPGASHLRWHHAVRPFTPDSAPGAVVIGFASEEGVLRNGGRPGQVQGPDALRTALGGLALPAPRDLYDAGTIQVVDGMLEAAQERLGSAVSAAIDAGHLPVVFGGGHEVAYGTYRGVADSQRRTRQQRLGVLNLDAHFDLRIAERPSSGTPFRQALLRERDRGMPMSYDVLGISQPSNTSALFDTAAEFGVRHLLDEHCGPTHRAAVDEFLDAVFEDVDLLYLTIDLDVLPAAVAPGVSAPAAFGVPLETIQHVCDRVAASGLLVAVDVAELNPVFDVDGRTARTAARLVHRIVTTPAAGS